MMFKIFLCVIAFLVVSYFVTYPEEIPRDFKDLFEKFKGKDKDDK